MKLKKVEQENKDEDLSRQDSTEAKALGEIFDLGKEMFRKYSGYMTRKCKK